MDLNKVTTMNYYIPILWVIRKVHQHNIAAVVAVVVVVGILGGYCHYYNYYCDDDGDDDDRYDKDDNKEELEGGRGVSWKCDDFLNLSTVADDFRCESCNAF